MINELDADKDGTISLTEFSAMMLRKINSNEINSSSWKTLRNAAIDGSLARAVALETYPGSVWRHESHFFYPFVLTDTGAEALNIPNMPDSNATTTASRRFGNADGHLLLDELCLKTVQVTSDENGHWGKNHSAARAAQQAAGGRRLSARRKSTGLALQVRDNLSALAFEPRREAWCIAYCNKHGMVWYGMVW